MSWPQLKISYEKGAFNHNGKEAKDRIVTFAKSLRAAPATKTQIKIAEVFSQEFGLDVEEMDIKDSLADMRIDSIRIIRFKKLLEDRFGLQRPLPVISMLQSPSIAGLGKEI